MEATKEIYEKTGATVIREVEGERVLLEMDENRQQMVRVHLINEVGARILELIDGSRTVQELSREICNEFDGEAVLVERDVKDFVQKLSGMGQIRLCDKMGGS